MRPSPKGAGHHSAPANLEKPTQESGGKSLNDIELRFLGANRQVTGSRHGLIAARARLLIDCGMFQEREYQSRNWDRCPLPASELDVVLLTHAHLDHCGLLPKLVAEGFRGPILSTAPTVDLAEIILRDSAKIQLEDLKYKQKRHRRENRRSKYPYEPLYTSEDVDRTMRLFRPLRYLEPVRINNRLTAVFHEAGHILGSAMAEVLVEDGGEPHRLLFSGDIGQKDKPFVDDPTPFRHADTVILESTYGNRDHAVTGDYEADLGRIIAETIGNGGNVVIPTFALERAQELVYHLGRLRRRGAVPEVPVYLDSPMAIDVTETFRRFRPWFDDDSRAMLENGEPPLRFPGLRMTRSVSESKAINESRTPSIILASAGMCNAGRIKHHLIHNLPRPESAVVFVGYQAAGTLGRRIVEGEPEVRIHGRKWPVRAAIHSVEGFSAHAGRQGLLEWVRHFEVCPSNLFLVHGEESASLALADELGRERPDCNVHVPAYGDRFVVRGEHRSSTDE